MSSTVPLVSLSNGTKLPILGLGTWKSMSGEVESAVKAAIDIGYRHFDTAYGYENEVEVGSAIRQKIQEGVVKREDIFLTTKLWLTFHERQDVVKGLQISLDRLGLDYVDLFLIHWPMSWKAGTEKFPRDDQGNLIYTSTDHKETWQGMEDCVDKGKTKAIGLSNFNEKQVQDILDNCRIKPVMQQVEVNPYFVNDSLVKFCQSKGIQVTAYSPLGSADRPWASPKEPVLLEDEKLKAIAQRLGKSVSQVIIRWLLQRDLIAIPKSSKTPRIKENFEVFDFELTPEDMALISSFDRGFPLVVPMADGPNETRIFRDQQAPNFPFLDYVDKLAAAQK